MPQNHLENAKITAQTMGQGLSTTATAMGQGLGAAADALSAAYATAGAQAEAALAAFEKEYCTPATFVPSERPGIGLTGWAAGGRERRQRSATHVCGRWCASPLPLRHRLPRHAAAPARA